MAKKKRENHRKESHGYKKGDEEKIAKKVRRRK